MGGREQLRTDALTTVADLLAIDLHIPRDRVIVRHDDYWPKSPHKEGAIIFVGSVNGSMQLWQIDLYSQDSSAEILQEFMPVALRSVAWRLHTGDAQRDMVEAPSAVVNAIELLAGPKLPSNQFRIVQISAPCHGTGRKSYRQGSRRYIYSVTVEFPAIKGEVAKPSPLISDPNPLPPPRPPRRTGK